MLTYLKFLFKSTNHHGVHSPFVYDYLTKCLYKKPQLSKNKLENLLLKSISYFDCDKIHIEDSELKSKLGLSKSELPLDLIVFNVFKLSGLLKMKEDNQIHNDTLILIHDLKKHQNEWRKAMAHPEITVSIDAFSLGILFIRKEQEKEHFTIRL